MRAPNYQERKKTAREKSYRLETQKKSPQSQGKTEIPECAEINLKLIPIAAHHFQCI